MEKYYTRKNKEKKRELCLANSQQNILRGKINLQFRTDLWCMFVDLELKHGSLERVREILERGLTIELKKKKMITILNKYYEVQKNYGTESSLMEIEERARKIAEKYTEKESDDE